MKEYYFLKGKEQNGPFTLEQLSDEGLTSETMVWFEGMENWQKLRDVPELAQTIKPKSAPPPPPSEDEEKVLKTEVSGQIKVTTEKTPNSTLEAIKPTKQILTWLIAWCGFHLLALLMSYSQIEIFNDKGKPRTDEFWPFVSFQRDKHSNGIYGWMMEGGKSYEELRDEKSFNGIFVNYDWSEFAFYVGGAIIIFLLVRMSNKQTEGV